MVTQVPPNAAFHIQYLTPAQILAFYLCLFIYFFICLLLLFVVSFSGERGYRK